MRVLRTAAVLAAALLAVALPGSPAQANQPDPPVGTVTDFGVQQTALTVFEGYLGTGENGTPVMYGVQMGEPGVLALVDPVSRTHLRTVELPGSSGAWGITQASDGIVYAGSYPNAHLYRYDPATGQSSDLGAPVAGQTLIYGLKAGKDGKVYGGTYPDAHAFSYSPAEGFRDFGRMYEGQNYAIDTAIDPEREVLWVAIGSTGHLIRYDLRTGEKRDILPEAYRGTANYPYDINLVGGHLFVKTSKFDAFVIDADTGELAPMVDAATGGQVSSFNLNSRGVSPLAPDGRSVYYTWNSDLYRYDVPTHTFGVVRDAAGAAVRAGGPAIGWGYLDGEVYALVGNYGGDALRYHPGTDANERFKLPFPPQPIPINNISAGEDGKVYTNLYINGNVAVLDPATGLPANLGRVGQTEGWSWHGGKMYLGTYPTGRVLVYDPTKPFSLGTNPKELFSLQTGHAQNRPFALVPTNDTLYVGSTPDYGEWGGALTVYDQATGTYTVHRHIVQDQGVTSLAMSGGMLWGGTSIAGGGGTTPKATEAKLFAFDLAAGRKTAEYTPVPGARTIGAVAVGRDGKVWGLADSTLFVFDPARAAVVHRVELPDFSTGAWDEIVLNTDEHVYAALGSKLLRVDPLSLRVTVLHDDASRMTNDGRGNLWFRGGENRLLRYTPPADTCPGSDLRSAVVVGDVDSGVANRYRPDGCTVNDLIRDAEPWPNRGAFVAHVTQVTRDLAAAGLITSREKDAIVAAAGRSDVGG